MSYHLELTESEIRDIRFVGHRYCWSEKLLECFGYEAARKELPEHVAWELAAAFEADTEGGHRPFPMLRGQSGLAQKLYRFWDSVV